mmetsp:Transcript_6152/g.17930  ORF Transcript_6152/g.17930 Transcript_6152/m.17930 type:complete len:213 (+) Transcript_6152:855-1493(+)
MGSPLRFLAGLADGHERAVTRGRAPLYAVSPPSLRRCTHATAGLSVGFRGSWVDCDLQLRLCSGALCFNPIGIAVTIAGHALDIRLGCPRLAPRSSDIASLATRVAHCRSSAGFSIVARTCECNQFLPGKARGHDVWRQYLVAYAGDHSRWRRAASHGKQSLGSRCWEGTTGTAAIVLDGRSALLVLATVGHNPRRLGIGCRSIGCAATGIG